MAVHEPTDQLAPVQRPGAIGIRVTGSGHELVLYPMAFGNTRLCRGLPGAPTYERGWCYRHHAGADALAALEGWDGEDVPPGRWYKDLGTGEVRNDGAPGSR